MIAAAQITNGELLTGNARFVIANISGYCTRKNDPNLPFSVSAWTVKKYC